jgi:tungstate transport system ATP-binding protein
MPTDLPSASTRRVADTARGPAHAAHRQAPHMIAPPHDSARTGLPVVATGLRVVRGATVVLHRVDLAIAPRSRTFILGPNGAGKSMLLRVLHGLVQPTQGSVRWGDALHAPRSQAMVFQRPVLLRRSAAANVRYALSCFGIRGAEAERRADEALRAVNLAHLARRPARVLSGGEQQRLALARAWALSPEVLFLDEPTASLDPAATRDVEAIVRDIHSHGTTIVMTTHNLAQARRLAEDVIYLQSGVATEQTPAELFFTAPRSPEAAAFLDTERT